MFPVTSSKRTKNGKDSCVTGARANEQCYHTLCVHALSVTCWSGVMVRHVDGLREKTTLPPL